MSMNTEVYGYNPDYAVKPGETIEETIEFIGLSKAAFARHLGVPIGYLNRVISATIPLSVEFALKLETVTKVPASYWNSLEANYRTQLNRLAVLQPEDRKWLKEQPRKEMLERGWIVGETELDQFRSALSFYRVADRKAWLEVWEAPLAAARVSPKYKVSPAAVAAFVRAGEIEAESIPCQPYSAEAFRTALAACRALAARSMTRETLLEMRSHCANAGVALVFVRSVAGAPLNGVTRWLGKDKAMILLSLRTGNEDVIWFSFFHEARHILDEKKKTSFLTGRAWSDSPDEKSLRRLLSGRNSPDAIVCRSDAVAARVMATLRKIGKEVPKDVLVAGFNDIGYAATLDITSVKVPSADIARFAFRSLMARMADPSLMPHEQVLPAPLTVRGSTIAYNIAGLKMSSAGISVAKGKLVLSDSIVFGNRVSGDPGNVGSDLALTTADGYADVSYSLLTATDSTSASAAIAGNLNFVKGVAGGDPLFVTTSEDAQSHVSGWTATSLSARYKASDIEQVLAFDVHLRTSAGYVTNGAPTVWLKAEKGVISPAIDAGDPSEECVEPEPNGLCRNAGFYGNTPEASKTVTSEIPLGFTDVTVDYPDGYSRPVIGFTVTGDPGCVVNAMASVKIGDADPFDLQLPGCVAGGTKEITLSDYYDRGTPIRVMFSGESSAGSVTPKQYDFEVDRDPAPWSGHGGGEGVLHVREGAMGARDGSSWTDAFDNIDDALSLAAVDATKTNVWIAGTVVARKAVVSRAVAAAKLEILGGFAGDEDSADERKQHYSTLDGEDLQDMVSINNAAGHDVVFERIRFTRGLNRALNKSGNGAIAIFDCRFLNNGTAVRGQSGRGVYLSGSAALTAAVISNCVFAGNAQCRYETPDSYGGKGFAIYAENFASLTVDDTLFVTNGAGPGSATGWNTVGREGHFFGSAIYASASPVTARRCQFRANRATSYSSSGGCVWLEGACGGSVFDHCLWTGNYEAWGHGGSASASTRAGALVVNLSGATSTVTVRHSTIAYNIAELKNSAAGISVAKGKLLLSDSIVFGNRVLEASATLGADLALTTTDGYADVAYTLFSTNDVSSVGAVAVDNCELGKGVVYDDPLLATGLAEALSHVNGWSGSSHNMYYKPADIGEVAAFNVHLRGRNGYLDEKTGKVVRFGGRTSPAIDAGDPESIYENEPSPNGHQVNLGAYGNTPWATMSKGGTLILVK